MPRSYQQYCPLARAMDVVGDRWTVLILRELFFAPKRFTDLATPQARELRTAMLELAKWGMQFLGPYDGEDTFSIEWLAPVLEEMADRDAARGVWDVYQFVIGGESLWVEVNDGDVRVRAGEPPRPPDLGARMDEETFMAIGFGTIEPTEALAEGRAEAWGDLTKTPTALEILSPAKVFAKAGVVASA